MILEKAKKEDRLNNIIIMIYTIDAWLHFELHTDSCFSQPLVTKIKTFGICKKNESSQLDS